MSFFRKIAQAGLEKVVDYFEGNQSQSVNVATGGSQSSVQSPTPNSGLKPSGNLIKLDRFGKAKYNGYEVLYYDVRFAKIEVYEPGAVEGQRFDLSHQLEGRWITLHDARKKPLPMRVCRQGKDVVIEWLT
jgi:hypothetical protein